jgi:mono/diheme cytochrome c family protein
MRVRWIVLAGSVLTVGLILLVFGVRGSKSEKPPVQIFPDMKIQPKYRAQGEDRFFPDRRDMRTPPSGTVAYGGRNYQADAGSPTRDPDFLQDDDLYYRGVEELKLSRQGQSALMAVAGVLGASALIESKEGVWVQRIPARIDPLAEGKQERWATLAPAMLDKGREVFNMTCALCHGGAGNGKGVTKLYGMAPANLHDDRIVAQPDGEIYNTLTNGKQSMKGYGHMIRPKERWAVVAFVRALQRSQRATIEELPPEERRKLGVHK